MFIFQVVYSNNTADRPTVSTVKAPTAAAAAAAAGANDDEGEGGEDDLNIDDI